MRTVRTAISRSGIGGLGLVGLVGLASLGGCDPFPSYPADAAYPVDGRVPRDAPVPDALIIDAPAPRPDAALCLSAIDQRLDACPNSRVSSCGNSAASPGGQALAQLVTPSMSGVVPSLRLWMSNDDKLHTRIDVALVDLEGELGSLAKPSFHIDDHVLAIVDVAMSDEITWNEVAFGSPPHVVAGQPYAIYVRARGGTAPAHWVLYNDFAAPNPDWYPRGRGFARPAGAEIWTPLATYQDFVFELRVLPDACR